MERRKKKETVQVLPATATRPCSASFGGFASPTSPLSLDTVATGNLSALLASFGFLPPPNGLLVLIALLPRLGEAECGRSHSCTLGGCWFLGLVLEESPEAVANEGTFGLRGELSFVVP